MSRAAVVADDVGAELDALRRDATLLTEKRARLQAEYNRIAEAAGVDDAQAIIDKFLMRVDVENDLIAQGSACQTRIEQLQERKVTKSSYTDVADE